MKRIAILLIFSAAFLYSGCEKELLTLNDFTITQSAYDYKTDWEQIVRDYYATRHEHNKPAGYLAHDNIDNYLISLGSWSGSRKIMASRK